LKGFEIVAAIFIKDNEVLCMQRGKGKYEYMSYKYEFPGGKVEGNESKTDALMRELKEEMDLDFLIQDDDYYMTTHHDYPDFSIELHCFLCEVKNLCFQRKEHMHHQWVRVDQLDELDWADADISVVKKLQNDRAG
jgi:8-oxo-dGTP diphosphatase